MKEKDIGGAFTVENDKLNKVFSAGNNKSVSLTDDVTTDEITYFVYTYKFDNASESKENTAALLPGEQIELIYPVEAKLNGLPRVRIAELPYENNSAYLPSFGQYGLSLIHI